MKLKSAFEAIRRFVLICSGANLKILEEECSSEQPKYTMIGTFIFLTSAFATLSGGYALYVGFDSAWLATLAGLLWGTFIFTVDRFIVSTIRKKEIDSDLPFHKKTRLWLGEFAKASPRLALALLISLVISTPLEVKYSEREINYLVNKNLEAKISQIRNEALNDQEEIRRRETENQSLKNDISAKENTRDQLRIRYMEEAQGISGTRDYGNGPVAERIREQLDNYELELKEFKAGSLDRIGKNEDEIKRLLAERNERRDELIQRLRDSVGFMTRLEAMVTLATESNSIRRAIVFISMLILLLECTPILMKLFSEYGPYDSVLDAKEYAIKLGQKKFISDINRKVNHDIDFNSRKDSAIQAVEEQLERESMINIRNLAQTEIEKAMADVAAEVVKDWMEKHFEDFTQAATSKNGKK